MPTITNGYCRRQALISAQSQLQVLARLQRADAQQVTTRLQTQALQRRNQLRSGARMKALRAAQRCYDHPLGGYTVMPTDFIANKL